MAKRWLSILVVLCLVFTYSGVTAFASINSLDYCKVDTKGVDGVTARPDSLAPGQIWTGKSMEKIYDASGKDTLDFEVTLSAWGATWSDGKNSVNPLDPNNQSVVITDDLKDFVFVEVTGATTGNIKNVNGQVVWTVGEDDILTADGAQITYTVRLADSWTTGKQYETGTAQAEFQPVEGNPYYWITALVEKPSLTISGVNWNNGTIAGVKSFTIDDLDKKLTMSVIDNQGPATITPDEGSSKQFTFDSSRSSENFIGVLDEDGMLSNLPSNLSTAQNGTWGSLWNKGGGGSKSYYFWFMGLEESDVLVIYEITPGGNGGNDGNGGSRFTIYPEYTHNADFTWVNDSVVTNLPVYGYIELTSNASPLTITKRFGSGIASGETFTFQVGFKGLPADYPGADGADKLADASVIPGADAVYQFVLGKDDTMKFFDVPTGVKYLIKEIVPDKYNKPVIDIDLNGASSQITDTKVLGVINGQADYTFTNSRDIPAIAVSKDVVNKKDFYQAGDSVIYKVVIDNTGNTALTNVTLNDSMDGKTGYSGPYLQEEDIATGNLLSAIPGIAFGGSLTVYYAYTVQSGEASDTVYNNMEVTATGKGIEVNGSDDETITIENPVLSITKTSDADTYSNGAGAVYKVTVSNSGKAPAVGVSLTDMMDGGYAANLIKDQSDSIHPENFTVPAAVDGKDGKVVFTFGVETVNGKSLDEVQALYEETRTDLEGAVSGINEQIDGFLNDISGYLTTGTDIESAIDDIKGQIKELNDELQGLDADIDAEAIADINTKIDELNLILNGDSDGVGLYGLRDAYNKAEKDLQYFEENGLDSETLNNTITNTAEITYKGATIKAIKTIEVTPEDVTQVTLTKVVSINDGGDWSQPANAAQFDSYKAGDAKYLVTITNNGSNTATVTLNDSLYGDINGDYTILPGESKEIEYNTTINGNDSYDNPMTVSNVAAITAINGDKPEYPITDGTEVTVPQKTFAKLEIIKKVETPKGWADRYAIFSDSAQDFNFKVTVFNRGTEDAAFTLEDSKLPADATLYTDEAMKTAATDEDFTVKANDSVTFYYAINLGAGKTENTAKFTISDGNNIKSESDRTGQDSAFVKVTTIPKLELSIEKKVTTEADFNTGNPTWKDSASVRNVDGIGEFVFRITVTNKTTDGDGYPVIASLADIMPGYEFEDGALDGMDSFIVNPGNDPAVFYLPVTLTADAIGPDNAATYTNVATLTEYQAADQVEVTLAGDVDENNDIFDTATATVEKSPVPVVKVGIDKQVKDGDGNWVASTNFSGRNANVDFRIILTANSDEEMGLAPFSISGSVKDELNGAPAPVADDFDWSYTLTDEAPQYIINYTLNLAAGTYTNVVINQGADITVGEDEENGYAVVLDNEQAAAAAAITTGGGHNNPGPGSSGNTPSTTLDEPNVPLAVMPEDNMVIPEDAVPLADIPQTGIENMGFSLLMLGMSLSALLAMAVLGRKQKNEI